MTRRGHGKQCRTFIRAEDGTERQCRLTGYLRNIAGKQYCLCPGHHNMLLGLPELYFSIARCQNLLNTVLGAGNFPTNYRIREAIRAGIRELSIREQHAIVSRFGLDRGKPATYDQIGQRLGVTRERARQIEQKAIRKLRHPSRLGRLSTLRGEVQI